MEKLGTDGGYNLYEWVVKLKLVITGQERDPADPKLVPAILSTFEENLLKSYMRLTTSGTYPTGAVHSYVAPRPATPHDLDDLVDWLKAYLIKVEHKEHIYEEAFRPIPNAGDTPDQLGTCQTGDMEKYLWMTPLGAQVGANRDREAADGFLRCVQSSERGLMRNLITNNPNASYTVRTFGRACSNQAHQLLYIL